MPPHPFLSPIMHCLGWSHRLLLPDLLPEPPTSLLCQLSLLLGAQELLLNDYRGQILFQAKALCSYGKRQLPNMQYPSWLILNPKGNKWGIVLEKGGLQELGVGVEMASPRRSYVNGDDSAEKGGGTLTQKQDKRPRAELDLPLRKSPHSDLADSKHTCL